MPRADSDRLSGLSFRPPAHAGGAAGKRRRHEPLAPTINPDAVGKIFRAPAQSVDLQGNALFVGRKPRRGQQQCRVPATVPVKTRAISIRVIGPIRSRLSLEERPRKRAHLPPVRKALYP